MKTGLSQFALALASLAILLQVLLYYVYEPVTGKQVTLLVQFFPAYFLLINSILHYFLLNSAKKSPQSFVRTFMAITTFKMLISLIFIVVIVFTTRPDFKAPAITFAVFYLLFMVLEVILLLKDLKGLNDNP